MDELPDDVKEVLDELESREQFTEWKKSHKEHRLAYLFTDFKPGTTPVWQVGYFKGKLMTSFSLGNVLRIDADEEVYETGSPLVELDLPVVKTGFKKALEIAEECSQKHKPFSSGQILAVLQTIDGKVMWNMTLVSEQYTFLNVKIEASSGKVVKEDFAPLFTMAKTIEGGHNLPKAG